MPPPVKKPEVPVIPAEGEQPPVVTQPPTPAEGNQSPEVKEEKPTQQAVVAKKKLATYRALENHECRVAHVTYVLEKDKEYELPEDVGAILSNQRLAYKK